MQLAYASVVKSPSPRTLRRQEKVALLADQFGPTRLAAEVRTPKSHVSAITGKNRGVGDDLAAKFDAFAVRNLGVRPGWIDSDEGADGVTPFRDLNAFEAQLVTLFRRLAPGGQREHLTLLHNAVEGVAPPPSVVSPWATTDRRKENLPIQEERRGRLLNSSRARGDAKRREGEL